MKDKNNLSKQKSNLMPIQTDRPAYIFFVVIPTRQSFRNTKHIYLVLRGF